MKRITLLIVFLALGLVGTSAPAFAQATDSASSSWFTGKINMLLMGRDNVGSSRFQEYREMPKGVSTPGVSLQGKQKGMDFALFGQNISRTDQRYTGRADVKWLGVSFDYNQIPHNFGNHAHSIESELAPGVWALNSTLRGTFENALDAQTSTAGRTYPFYAGLFSAMVADAPPFDIKGLRQRGNIELNLGKKLPFDLKVIYLRDVKTGYRGNGGGVIYSAINEIVELPASLNEVTQDLGFRAAVSKGWGNVYGAYAHNWYNNRQETTVFDNPLQAADQAYVAGSGTVPPQGGPGSGRLIGLPDNSADTGSFGVLLKFKKQTRVSADVGMGRWTQNAQIYPYTINSTILTTAGVRADSYAALDKQSLDGKIDTTTLNFGFSSRPIDGLGLRMRYRNYHLDNKTPTFVRTGAVGSQPDRSWTALTAANYAADPLGYATANPYGSQTGRFDVQASYDIRDLTFEGTYRNTQIDRTYREATKGSEQGGSVAAVLHPSTWMRFRGVFDTSKRKASGYDTTLSTGLQADESERDSTRAGADLELMPNDQVSFMLAYSRRHEDYPNRPNRAAGVEGTSNGLLRANFDTYTVEANWTPGARGDVGAYYTWEKNLSTTRYGGTGSSASAPYTPLMSMLTFDGSDKTHTFGLNAHVVMVPDKWAFDFNGRRQNLDGLMAVAGDPAGSFALARAAYGGIKNITDYNDTKLTTFTAQLDYMVRQSWSVMFGYAYERYVFADAYSIFGNQNGAGQFDDGNETFPASGGFYLKANDGTYKASIVYTRLTYRW